MKRKELLIAVTILLSGTFAMAQITQTIRGTVVDQESQIPLIGVNVSLTSVQDAQMGASTDLDGHFRIGDVPVGRHDLVISYLGYGDLVLNDIIVSSGKEVILDLAMEETVTELEEVTIVAKRNGEVQNEVATVSAREFSVQETDRYAGSRGEPARMASNFAGVQGADDQRNDLVIRGNTPYGVLWRLEGINIPNPNHFAVPGTGGGSVTILNNKFLSNSDFFTGAFPAEYANGIAGVFDLKMRNGNNEKHEFSGQLGFLGTELMAEGPISRENRSSYLVMFRYSTLKLFKFMNIQIGTDAVPKYYDGAFRLNFPMKGGANFSVFGIGGDSDINIILSDLDLSDPENQEFYGANSRDQIFGSNMYTLGLNYVKPINTSMYFKATVSASHYGVDGFHELIIRKPDDFIELDHLEPILDYHFRENRYSAYFFLNKKFSRKLSMKAGINYDLNQVNYIDSARSFAENMQYPGVIDLEDWRIRWNSKDFYSMVQPYVQFRYRANDKLTVSGGITSVFSDLSENSYSLAEPRMGMSYKINERQKISLGAGLHSQLLAPYSLYYSNETIGDDPQEYNLDLGFTKSAHAVLAYDIMWGNYFRIKAETYYQYLYDIPVDETAINSYSLLNEGSGYGFLHPDPLKNEGTGRNYGFELTMEKFFHKGYYFLLTGSVFDAKYKGTDNEWRNTTYNGRFAANALFAREFKLGKASAINLGGKFTMAGGRWFGEVDHTLSSQYLEPVWINETVNTKQFRNYFRVDLKLNYRINTRKLTHEIGLDIVNVTGQENILTLTYEPSHPDGPVIEQHQLGFFPIFYYKVDF